MLILINDLNNKCVITTLQTRKISAFMAFFDFT